MANILFRRNKNEISSDEVEEDDTWDDTALIDAYDKAVGLAMKEVQRRMEQGSPSTADQNGAEKATKKKTKKKSTGNKQSGNQKAEGKMWEVGMPCRAKYTVDGDIYEAIIESLSLEDDNCTVKFLGYNNTQQMSTEDLYKTQGRESVRLQIEQSQLVLEDEAQAAAMEWTSFNPDSVPPASHQGKVKREKIHRSSHNPIKSEASRIPSFPMDSSIHMPIPPPPPISQFTAHLPEDEAEALSSMCMSWYVNGFHTGFYMGLKQGQQPK